MFFNKVCSQDFDQKATEHWNKETRRELAQKLESEIKGFQEAKRIHTKIKYSQKGKIKETTNQLVLPSHEFNRDRKVVTRNLNIKWNYTEFSVKYICYQNQYFVWKYFLSKLLVD